MLVFVLYCGYSLAVEVDAVGSRHAETQVDKKNIYS